MILTVHQPAYLPWLGYLARIAVSDIFIFLDTVQFEKNSYINRNQIKTPTGPQWLTVPVYVRGHLGKPMTEIEIDNHQDWRKKHLRSIEYNYRRAPRFGENFPKLFTLFKNQHIGLADLCFDQLHFWLRELKIETPILRASQLPVTGQKSDLILALCQHVEASIYLSGPMGKDYLQEDDFIASDIRLVYHDYVHPIYPQLHGRFLPAMSIIDYWMNNSDFQSIWSYS